MAQKFSYLRKLNSVAMPCALKVPVGASQTIVKGDLIKVDGTNGKAIKAGAASTLIIGIANADVTTGATPTESLEVLLIDEFTVLKAAVAGTTKTSVVVADCFGKAKFDIKDTSQEVNLDDTTGGFVIPITASSSGYVEAVISSAALWNA